MSTEETDESTGRRGGRVVSADRQAARAIIGEKLRTMRARARLSAVALAAAIGTNRATVKSYEDGESEPLVLDALAISAVLGVPMDVLFRADVQLPPRSSAPVAAPAPAASPAPGHAPAAAPMKAAPARRVTPAATVAPVAPAATVATPAPAARPSSAPPSSPFAGQLAKSGAAPAASIPAASTSTQPAPPASAPPVRTPIPAPRTAPVRPVAPVAGRPSSWAEAFAAEEIAAWGPGHKAWWNVSTGAGTIACPECGEAKRPPRKPGDPKHEICKCIERRWMYAAVRPARRDQAIDPEQIAGILGAVVDEDMDAVSLAMSAPGGEWRVMIGDEPAAAVPRAEVDHAIECGLVRLTRAPSGAPVWRLTDKGLAYLGATPGAATSEDPAASEDAAVDTPAASEAPVDTGAGDAPAPAAVSSRPAFADLDAAFNAAFKRIGAAPASGTLPPLPSRRKDLPPAPEVIEVSAPPAEDDDDY